MTYEVLEGGKLYDVSVLKYGSTPYKFYDMFWNYNGIRSREWGPAEIYKVEHKNEIRIWMKDGLRHRVDYPAFVGFNGVAWWVNGKLHREDGPACFENNKNNNRIFALNGVKMSKQDFLKQQKNKIIKIDGKLHLIDGRPIKFDENLDDLIAYHRSKKYSIPFEL